MPWHNEFLVFCELAKADQIGLDVRLTNKNVANRILPIQIHDLDTKDQALFEKESGRPLRSIDFIFRSHGVNRPLTPQDSRTDNLNRTFYRDQLNKTANAIEQIIVALSTSVFMIETGRSSTTQSREEKLLRSLWAAVLNNLGNEQFGVSELSREVAISRFQLRRKLKAIKGVSISQYIRETRLEEAMKLLYADVATVSEIAFRVGFSSPSYFNSCFQKYCGFPPGEVKKRREDGTETLKTAAERQEDEQTKSANGLSFNPAPGKKSVLKWALAIVAALAMLTALYYNFGDEDATAGRELSIAVLPLSNLTPILTISSSPMAWWRTCSTAFP